MLLFTLVMRRAPLVTAGPIPLLLASVPRADLFRNACNPSAAGAGAAAASQPGTCSGPRSSFPLSVRTEPAAATLRWLLGGCGGGESLFDEFQVKEE